MREFILRTIPGRTILLAVVLIALLTGCASPDAAPSLSAPVPPPLTTRARLPLPVTSRPSRSNQIERVSYQETVAPNTPSPDTRQPLAVDELIKIAIERNPRIARATIAIDAAQGRYVQAGLYPNPVLAVIGDELGDRTGPAGIWTAPQLSQEIVTGRKLSLAQAVAAREVDQAALDVLAERYGVVGGVRAVFYEAFTLQQRADILVELVKLAEDAVKNGQTLLENKRIARLDLVQLEVERERFRAEARAVAQELPAAYRRLAAITGDQMLPITSVAGSFANLPTYDLEGTREIVVKYHPDARSARVGVERAQAAVRRAQAEPIPNLTFSTGYTRQNQNVSNDWLFGVSAPIPVWNRNQGNIRTAQAELAMAVQTVGRVENELAARVAAAFQIYLAAREKAEQYRMQIIPRAEETYKLSLEAFKGGQFEYLRVIQAQRAIAEARLELNRSLGEAWRAAGELSGLLLEEVWPGPAPPPEGPMVQPMPKPMRPPGVPEK